MVEVVQVGITVERVLRRVLQTTTRLAFHVCEVSGLQEILGYLVEKTQGCSGCRGVRFELRVLVQGCSRSAPLMPLNHKCWSASLKSCKFFQTFLEHNF